MKIKDEKTMKEFSSLRLRAFASLRLIEVKDHSELKDVVVKLRREGIVMLAAANGFLN
jgi:hypothetical protein